MHSLHMPAHLWDRAGEFRAGEEANRLSVAAVSSGLPGEGARLLSRLNRKQVRETQKKCLQRICF